MAFSRQEYWSELLFLPLGNLPDPGIKPESLLSSALAGVFFTTSATREAQNTAVMTTLVRIVAVKRNKEERVFLSLSCEQRR